MKMKEKNTFLFRGRTKTLYFMTLIALLAVGAIGYLLVPTSGTVSAQSGERAIERDVQNLNSFPPVGSNKLATPDMISNALSNRTGNLSDLVSSVSQLPCTEVSGELGGRKFQPGVYCVPSARLAGEMVLDGGGDANAIFIFNAKGSLEAMRESNISLVNEAKAFNVFFVANNATIGEGSNFRAGILTKNTIEVNSTARVAGRTLSVSGKVDAPEAASPDGGGIGNLEICKRVITTPTNTGNLANRVFNFTITGVNIPTPINVSVRAGFCTSDILVPAGPAVITETNITNDLTGTGNPIPGNFALVAVNTLSPTPNTGGSSLGAVNLAARTAAIVIGGVNSTSLNQLTVEFVNRFAITGFVEICKRAAFLDGSTTLIDPDLQGTFRFTIAGVFIAGSNTVLQQFNVAVGQCTGAIAVTVPFDQPAGTPLTPREGTVVVTELGEDGSFLVSTNTFPADRAVGETTFNANGGGSRTVRVIEGGVATETIVFFFNRSRPGQLKVCKIAGPGIPLNTLFTFRVRGLGPIDAAGTIAPFERQVVVAAGAPNAQGGGGSCAFVPGFGAGIGLAERQTFVIGSVIRIDELPVTINGNAVLVSNITTTSTFAPGSPNLAGRFAEIIARRDIIEVTFTNFLFQPTILKVCKIGLGTALGGSFTFDVTLANPASGGINPAFTVPVTVTAGAPGPQGGNCVIVPTVNGSMSLQGGAFSQGSTVTITERAAAGTLLTGITSPTSTLAPCTPGDPRCSMLTGANGLVAGVTQVTFTNGPAPAASRFDFDGDNKADVSVFRSSNGGWYINQSRDGLTGRAFGQEGDQMVPADYDGDGKTDIAVYRPSNGTWYINRTTAGFTGVNFGNATDIPQAVDFNSDGKAELAVFRPSNGYWYVMNLVTGESTGTQFGATGDLPVAADYDGDGKADYAVFRPSTGGWYILRSRDGLTGVGFGQAGDKPVPADYDGDGKVDIGVYRPSNGGWYLQQSTAGYKGLGFGMSNDMPSPADYDGDGKADIAVFRPLEGTFYILRSLDGMVAEKFGQNGDKPTPNAYVR
jgi:hypothetical protein